MTEKPDFSALKRHYAQMSEGDRSCVTSVLQIKDASQATAVGSHHDKFYEELSRYGMANSVPLGPELEELAVVRSWKLTDIGRKKVPVLLLALTTSEFRQELYEKRHKEAAGFAAKFAIIYLLGQLAVFGIRSGIVSAKLNVPVITENLPVAGVIVSVLLGQYLACLPWGRKQSPENFVKNIARYEFIATQTKTLALYSGLIVMLIHLAIEAAERLIISSAQYSGAATLFIQSVVLFVTVMFLSRVFLPQFIQKLHGKQFRPNG